MMKRIGAAAAALMLTLAMVLPAAAEGEKFSASEQFSATRGKGGFYYFAYDAGKDQWQDMKFSIDKWQWQSEYPGNEPYLLVTNGGKNFHPDIRDIVIGWTPPGDGVVREENVLSKGNNFDNKGNGVRIRIRHYSAASKQYTVLWPKNAGDAPYGLDGGYAKLPKNVAPDVRKLNYSFEVTVKKGDFIYYEINNWGEPSKDANGVDSSDTVVADPTPEFEGSNTGFPEVAARTLAQSPYQGGSTTTAPTKSPVNTTTGNSPAGSSTTARSTANTGNPAGTTTAPQGTGGPNAPDQTTAPGVPDTGDTLVQQVVEGAKIKPLYDDVHIDYDTHVMSLRQKLRVQDFLDTFKLEEGYTLTVLSQDGQAVSDMQAVMADTHTARLSGDEGDTVFTIRLLYGANPAGRDDTEGGLNPGWIILIVAGAVVLVGGAAALILILKKKKTTQD